MNIMKTNKINTNFTLQLLSSNVSVTNVSGAFWLVRFRKCEPFNSSIDNRPKIWIIILLKS